MTQGSLFRKVSCSICFSPEASEEPSSPPRIATSPDAWTNKKDPPKPQTVGVCYMLKGDKGASNTDPYATKPTADNQWVVSGPHIMILPTDVSQLNAYPTDWTKGGPWVMWKGTPYAHIMVPTTSMAKSASKAPAEKKAADKK